MSRTIIIRSISSTQNSLEGLSELWTEDRVDDGVQSGVEVSQPEEKTRQGEIEHFCQRKKKNQNIPFCWFAHKFSQPKYLIIDAILADWAENS